jgi:hypothetical protein
MNLRSSPHPQYSQHRIVTGMRTSYRPCAERNPCISVQEFCAGGSVLEESKFLPIAVTGRLGL